MQLVRLGIDIDGVLADFNDAYRRKLFEVTNEDRIPVGFQPSVWNYASEQYGYTKAQESATWEAIKRSSSFWLSLDPLEGAVRFLDEVGRMIDHGHEAVFVTSRPGFRAKQQTEEWLKWHGLDATPTVVIASVKGPVYAALGITDVLDDKPEHVEAALRQGCSAAMLLTAWNVRDQDRITQLGGRVISSINQFWGGIYATV